MRIVPFPRPSGIDPEESWLAELEAALGGSEQSAMADSWRELRSDVRALAPPIDPDFERELGERIAQRIARTQPRRLGRRLRRPAYLGATAAVAVSAVIALIVVVDPSSGPSPHDTSASSSSTATPASASASKGASGEASTAPQRTSEAASVASATNAPDAAPSASITSAASGAASAPGRVQQLDASINLTATPSEVQTVADRVSRLTVSEGGFVQSSHVNAGERSGEANLMLILPSAKLSAALASLAQLAPVRGESQSLQDITSTYDAARQRLNDATAERQALRRALAKASTAGEIDSLRERLTQAGGAIAHASAALHTVSQRASTAEVEVSVIGVRKTAKSGGLTYRRALQDAGRVLVGSFAVLLNAAAVLIPLAIALAALSMARRAWLRHARERVLSGV